MSVGLYPDDIRDELSRPTARSAIARRFAGLTVLLLVLGAALLVVLHLISKDLNPLSQPISKYVFTSDGWLFDAAIVVLALGLATLLCALVAAGLVELGSGSFVITVTCCVCLVILDAVPDRSTGSGLSASGWAHWVAAMVAFGGLLVTPVVLGARHRSDDGCSRLPGIARWVSYFAGVWFALLLTGSVVEEAARLAVWNVGGLVERVLSLSEVVVAMLLAVWAGRGCSCTYAGARWPALDSVLLGKNQCDHVARGETGLNRSFTPRRSNAAQ